MRLKQICNRTSQWLGDGAWAEPDSGKPARLRDIVEVIAAWQEKVSIFRQFREMTAPLPAFLGPAFGRTGLVLQGCFFDSINWSISSSTVSRQMNLCPRTLLICPIWKALSVA